MLTLFLKASIRLFSSDLKRSEAILDLFPLLAEKFESERWQRLQNSHIKEEWITESFFCVDFICNIICYVVYFSLTEQIQQPSLSFRPTSMSPPEGRVQRIGLRKGFSLERGCFFKWIFHGMGGCCAYLKGC